jgi:hypothetical protein
MYVHVPSVAFVAYLDGVEATYPVACKLSLAQIREPFQELILVSSRYLWCVFDCQYDVLRLRDFARPPFNGAASVHREAWLTLCAEKVVAPIGKLLDGAAG